VHGLMKTSLTFAVSLLVGVFKAFVLMSMWKWFVTPVFHMDYISFWQMLGLVWIVQLFANSGSENPAETLRWENLFLRLDACVPEHKSEELREELKQNASSIWRKFGIHIFAQLVGYTVTLGLGWVAHVLYAAGPAP
jgi:hypothetical protein